MGAQTGKTGPRSAPRRVLRAAIPYLTWAIGIGIFVFLVAYFGNDVLKGMRDLDPRALVAFILVSVALTSVWATRWALIAGVLAPDRRIGVGRCLIIIWQVGLISQVLPREIADVGGRAWAQSQRYSLPIKTTAHGCFVDRVLDLGLLMLMLPSAIFFLVAPQRLEAALLLAMIGALVAVVFLTVCLPMATRATAWMLEAVAAVFRRGAVHPSPVVGTDARPEFGLALRAGLSTLTLIKFALLALRAVCVSWAIASVVAPGVLVVLSPVGQASWAISFSPGGLGVYELGWFGALVYVGTAPAVAAVFITVQRALILGAALVLYIPALLIDTMSARAR